MSTPTMRRAAAALADTSGDIAMPAVVDALTEAWHKLENVEAELAEARRERDAMRDLRDAAVAESSEWAREVERLTQALSSSPGAAWLATARELIETLAAFAHAPEAGDSFLVTGADVNRARALLASPEVKEMKEMEK